MFSAQEGRVSNYFIFICLSVWMSVNLAFFGIHRTDFDDTLLVNWKLDQTGCRFHSNQLRGEIFMTSAVFFLCLSVKYAETMEPKRQQSCSILL